MWSLNDYIVHIHTLDSCWGVTSQFWSILENSSFISSSLKLNSTVSPSLMPRSLNWLWMNPYRDSNVCYIHVQAHVLYVHVYTFIMLFKHLVTAIRTIKESDDFDKNTWARYFRQGESSWASIVKCGRIINTIKVDEIHLTDLYVAVSLSNVRLKDGENL